MFFVSRAAQSAFGSKPLYKSQKVNAKCNLTIIRWFEKKQLMQKNVLDYEMSKLLFACGENLRNIHLRYRVSALREIEHNFVIRPTL